MNFKTTLDSAFNIQVDLLIDILAFQTIIVDRLVTMEAEKTGNDRKDILGAWNEKIKNQRESIAEEIFAKHGPDPSADLGLNESDVS